MKLIVGLGNPGKEYKNNRHNVGYLIVDQITKSQISNLKSQIQNSKLKILKPSNFMNNSGEDVKKEANYYKIEPENIFVIHDDLDLEFGTVRVSFGSTSAGHNGAQSVIDQLKTNDFWRIRVGIGRPPLNIPPEKYVLQDFKSEEQKHLEKIIDQSAKIVLELTLGPFEKTIKIL